MVLVREISGRHRVSVRRDMKILLFGADNGWHVDELESLQRSRVSSRLQSIVVDTDCSVRPFLLFTTLVLLNPN
jgi:hypothetical protein